MDDPRLLREEALVATERFFSERGIAPDEDSEEWEEEYRRQFARAKERRAAGARAKAAPQPNRAAAGAEADDLLPTLSGHDAERRWAAAVRADRLKAIRDPAMRRWLATSWTSAKEWISTRELDGTSFGLKIEAQYSAWRRRSDVAARARETERRREQAAAASIDRQVEEAGISVEGLIELIDLSPRARPARPEAKIADLALGERSLRVFETSALDVLMVIEKGPDGRREYAIERDAGLAADLGLYARQASVRRD